MTTDWDSIQRNLASLYGAADAAALRAELQDAAAEFREAFSQREYKGLRESDAALIVYADSIIEETADASPLQNLTTFLGKIDAASFLPIVHLLPFYPWDTDRGFSVKDYYQVDPRNGRWEDVSALSKSFRLMFDFVANHASIENPLIQGALIARHLDEQDSRFPVHGAYKDFVIAFNSSELPSEDELAALTRPRAAPVLSEYHVFEDPDGALYAKLGAAGEGVKILGKGWVWTTFSREKKEAGAEETRQVDLNFKNPKVFLESVKILFFYCDHGASLIRLDAIGYLWKKLGSSSIHEPETHLILAVLQEVIRSACPEVPGIAEVNEPQERVLEYLGAEAARESDLVYQFSHFPLAVHAVQSESAKHYTKWLGTLEPFEGRQFITVLGSHDGLGMKPARGLLGEDELSEFEKRLINSYGGRPNLASMPGGKRIVYEVCGTPWDLINRRNAAESFDLQLTRYLAVVALGLIPRGLPAFYLNGLLGSLNYDPPGGLDENRTMNREMFSLSDLQDMFAEPGGRTGRVLAGIRRLLEARATQPAFCPDAPALKAVNLRKHVVAAVLPAPSGADTLYSIVNVSSSEFAIDVGTEEHLSTAGEVADVLSGEVLLRDTLTHFSPYQVRWLRRQ